MFGTKIGQALLACALSTIAGVQSAQAAVTTYSISERFNQVVYNSTPDRDTYFTGTFDFDSATLTVSNLQGLLSQAMTNKVPGLQATRQLSYQLSSIAVDTNGDSINDGLLVSAFFLNDTNVFSNSGGIASTTGWATGGTKEIVGNDNAYVTIFVNTADPLAALTPAQNYKLAYGDCTSGSLMGMGSPATCMTGWLTSAGLKGGTMQGVDQITQTIAAVPEPESYAMMMAGLGLIGFIARRRNTK
jgi:hypothetical protein